MTRRRPNVPVGIALMVVAEAARITTTMGYAMPTTTASDTKASNTKRSVTEIVKMKIPIRESVINGPGGIAQLSGPMNRAHRINGGEAMKKALIVVTCIACGTFLFAVLFRQQKLESKAASVAGRDFFHAAYLGDVDQLDGYFRNGVSPNAKNVRARDMTPLMYAAWGGNAAAIRYLIANGANVNDTNSEGVTALMLAAYANQDESARVLLDNGANPDLFDKKYNSALTFAIAKENLSMIRLLASRGVGLNQRGRLGRSPLAVAVSKNKPEAVRTILFLPEGSRLAELKDATAMNPLMLAAKSGNVNMVFELLKVTKDINSTDFKGRTALDLLNQSESREDKSSALQAIRSRGGQPGRPITINRKYEVPRQARRIRNR